MIIFNEFQKVASANLNKIAVLNPNLAITYSDVLRLHAYFERALAEYDMGHGKKIAFHTNQYEFSLAMLLFASVHGHRLYFIRPDLLASTDVEFDWHISEQRQPDAPKDRAIQIKPNWFKGEAAPVVIESNAEKPDAVVVFNTSGSTGSPKLFPVPEQNFVSGTRVVGKDAYGPTHEKTRIFMAPSLAMRWTQHGNFRILLRGGSVFSLPDRQANIIPLIDKFRIDSLGIPPALADEMLNLPDLENYCESLKYINLGGAYVSPELVKALAKRTGANVSVSYGSTETGGVTAATYQAGMSPPSDYLGELIGHGTEVGFFSEALELMPNATEGILGVRNKEHVWTTAYEAVDDDVNAKTFVDGYFITGDIVRREGDSLILIGRTKNIINISGNKASLERVESALADAFGGYRFVGLSYSNAKNIEELWLFYIGDADIKFQEAETVLKSNFKGVPLSGLLRVSNFPLNDRGKIEQKALIAQVEQQIANG